MSKVTKKSFDITYESRNAEGVMVSTSRHIENVISETYEGCFFCLTLQDDSVFRIHVDRCVTIEETVAFREAVPAPSI